MFEIFELLSLFKVLKNKNNISQNYYRNYISIIIPAILKWQTKKIIFTLKTNLLQNKRTNAGDFMKFLAVHIEVVNGSILKLLVA